MKATGMVRRMDNLGRIVIPKEIREVMKIRDGEKLEVFVENDGKIVFKKYLTGVKLEELAEQFSASVNRACGIIMAVVEADTVIACSPAVSKNETVGQKISHGAEQIIRSRKLYQRRENEEAIPLTEDKRDKYFIRALMPVLSRNNIIGAVAAICLETLTEPTESEVNLLRTAAVFFGEYLETM